MSIDIITKKIRDKWYCLATLYGYDYSFEGLSVDAAQMQMRELLSRNKVSNIKWHKPEIIKQSEVKKNAGNYNNYRTKIDNF